MFGYDYWRREARTEGGRRRIRKRLGELEREEKILKKAHAYGLLSSLMPF